MSSSNPYNDLQARLADIYKLERKRAELAEQVDALDRQLVELKKGFFGLPPARLGKAPGLSADALAERVARAAAAPRRGLRSLYQTGNTAEYGNLILTALERAGEGGVVVSELAEQQRVNPRALHAWLHGNLADYPMIAKVAAGHYRLSGPLPEGVKSRLKFQAKPSVRPRGEFSAGIVALLTAAGPEGITVTEIAAKMETRYENIYGWFKTTGKPRAVKVSPGRFALAVPGAAPAPPTPE